MSLSHRQQHQLRRIQAGLLRSDPQLGLTPDMFTTLYADEGMPVWEQVSSRQNRIQQATAWAVTELPSSPAALPADATPAGIAMS